jgi:hypothetical protein
MHVSHQNTNHSPQHRRNPARTRSRGHDRSETYIAGQKQKYRRKMYNRTEFTRIEKEKKREKNP